MSNTNKKRKRSKKKKWPIVLLIIAALILVIAIGVFVFFRYMTGGLKTVKLDKNDLGIVTVDPSGSGNSDSEKNSGKIINLAMFGVDTRDESVGGRSDSIIILSLNTEDNSAKMISVLRDTKVPIDGYEPQKINAAYMYGGPTLAIRTLNQNFKLDIENFITVDFSTLKDIIDILGGVEIYLEPEEVDYVNEYADTAMDYDGYDAVEGWNTLNGAQAVSYSRIRTIDSDYYRAGRQQLVLGAVLAKLREKPASQYPSLLKNLLECVETSYSFTDLLGILNSMDLKDAKLSTYTMPDPDYEPDLFGGLDETGSWVWIYDLDLAAERIHEIIYEKAE